MYDRVLYSKVVRFQRTAMGNTFAIFATLQGHGEKLMKKSLDQMPWLSEKSKSTCMGLSDSCMHGSTNLGKFIDKRFDDMERLLGQADSVIKPKAKPALAGQAAPARKAAGTKKKAAAMKKAGSKAAGAGATDLQVRNQQVPEAAQKEATVQPVETSEAKPTKPRSATASTDFSQKEATEVPAAPETKQDKVRKEGPTAPGKPT